MKKVIMMMILTTLVLSGCMYNLDDQRNIMYNQTVGFCKQICESHNNTYLEYRANNVYENDVCVCKGDEGINTYTV